MEIRERIPHPGSDKAPVSFQEFAGHFSKAEWRLLQEWQMELYQILMKEIHQALTSLGPLIATSVFSLRPKEKDQFSEDDLDLEIRRHNNSSPSYTIMNSDLTLRKKRKAAHHVDDPHDTNHWESQYGQSTVFPFRNFDADLKKKDEFDLDLTASVAEVKVCRSRQSSGPAIITPAASFSFVDDGNTYSTDPQHSETCGSISDPTEKAVNTAVLSFKIKEENESYFGQLDRSEIRENIISPTDEEIGQVGPLIIKEDGTTHSMDHQDLETKESMNSSKDNQAMKRKRNYRDTVKSTKKTPVLGKAKAKVFQSPLKGTICRRQWSGNNQQLREERTALCDNAFINDTNSNLHRGVEEVLSNRFNEFGSSDLKTKLFMCPQNGTQFTSTQYENCSSQKRSFVENRESHSALKGVNPERLLPFRCNKYKQDCNQKSNPVEQDRAPVAERQLRCTKCHKRFSKMSNLIRHQATHAQECPYQCTECDKSFNRNDNLIRHQRSHARGFQAHQEMLSTTATSFNPNNIHLA
ncbi:zinc finger protein 436-like isoform X2 [Ambystoma mexicanum]|uniref:zinc finger protein 436-like isoform X2 n=1 Tax=Ambystoma mexicanum TaxID=8296 RepID=UPI0037E7F2E6